jgi:2-C-methyl-D-erythritol 2,4-cyclodiphosphate synthase
VSLRVGQGFDAHAFSSDPDRPLVLGGVTIVGHPGLAGHSDADAISHAVADSLLGAAGLEDLGTRFPASDPRWRGVDSTALLADVVSAVRGEGWSVTNVDCAVVLQGPRLAEHRDAMEARLSELVGGPVRVKPKSPEGLGALGRAEGVACWAVCLLESAP